MVEQKRCFGVMLDCSRNAVMTVERLKDFICDLEKMGYNSLQLYTEDTYEVEGEPLFGHMRGRFSKAELKEIDAFASQHGIEVIPCIQTLAHVNQLFIWQKYRELRDCADILLAGDEKTYELIEKMFATYAECFKSRTINIGMDEAALLGAGEYMEANGYRPRFDIILDHLNRVAKIGKRFGYRMIMWSDMFFRIVNGGLYYGPKCVIPDDVKKKIPENVELCYWDYYHEDKQTYDDMIDSHLTFGKNLWFAGGAWKWLGFQSGNQKTFDTTLPAIKSCNERGVKDIFITMWGDNGAECPAYAALPGVLYAAECIKGNFDLQDCKKRFKELFDEDWDDFMLLDLTMPEDIPLHGEDTCGAKEMLYADPFLGKYDYCVLGNGREVAVYRDYAQKLAAAKKRSKRFAYIFESYEKLCRLMAVKYDLGYRTKTAYQAGDKKALKAIQKDYVKGVKLAEDFLVAYRKMWFTDSKPHGFDVQDIRIGGVIQRLKSCGQRLADYLKGKVDKIAELEEPMVNPYIGSKADKEGEKGKGVPCSNLYVPNASVNAI